MAGFQIESAHELESALVLRDTRRLSKKISDWLLWPENFALVVTFATVILLIFPIFIPVAAIPALMLFSWQRKNYPKIRLPMRYPSWTKWGDPSGIDDKMGGKKGIVPAQGIYFLGNQRPGMTIRGGEELWVSDSDIRVHRLVMAATGGGKTNTLTSWLCNTLSFGSGGMYVDGKAQNDVFANIWKAAWAVWREDDVLTINYMTGDADQFEVAMQRSNGKYVKRLSNTMNPFGFAPADTINNILQSLMPKASGDGAIWQNKANNMTTGVVQAVCYLRAKKEIRVSAKTIRHYMALPNLIDLWLRKDIPEAAIAPVNAYLTVGLPGFNAKAAKEGRQQGQQTMDQHGYLSGQFAPVLGMLADVYDYIFADVMPEVDVTDCVYNNRLLVVLIPSLRKSEQEAASLGKIVVAAAKMMMGANLGSSVEGEINDIINNRPTNSDAPYEIILDELGYYFAPGIDLMFAQGRSLGLALTASGQDFQAMARGENKNAVESMIANTRIKVAFALEDPKDTFEIFSKSAGEAYVARVSRFERMEGMTGKSNNMIGGDDASIERQSRITLEELRALGPGDAIFLYKQRVIRASAYNVWPAGGGDLHVDDSIVMRLNTMLPIRAISMQEISHLCKSRKDLSPEMRIYSIMVSGSPPRYASSRTDEDEKLISAITSALEIAKDIDPGMSPAMRGIVMFQSVVQEMRKMKKTGETKGEAASIPEVEDGADMSMFAQSETLRQSAKHPNNQIDDPLAFLDETPIQMTEVSDDDEVVFGGSKVVKLSDETRNAVESIASMSHPDVDPTTISDEIEAMLDNAVDYTMSAFTEQAVGGENSSILDVEAIMREFAELERLAMNAGNGKDK